jgi:hypothetical protein
LTLHALSLSTLQTSMVLDLGAVGSVFDMAAASASDGHTYYTTLQHTTPGPPASTWAETLAVSLPPAASLAQPSITARMNTSACLKVWVAAPHSLLCLADHPAFTLQQFDMLALTTTVVGSFPAKDHAT